MQPRAVEIARKAAILLFFIFMMLWMAPALMAQSQTISGTVVDPSGGVIPGAQITIIDNDKGSVARETMTDQVGRFQALNIQPGNYTIAVEMSGFKKAQISVKLDVNSKLDVGQIKMEIGAVSETVQITEALPAIQTSTMEKSYLVEPTQIKELPMNGRNWVALMSTVPGMTSGSRNDFDMNFNDVSAFHALGGRGSQNNFYLDGSPNLDVGDNQSQYTQPSIDSIQEFKVQQSTFNAEYGRNSGMVVAVQTKSGSNRFHGTLYEYVRNNALDAMNTGFSDKWNSLRASNPSAKRKDVMDKLRYNQFGGNFSGWVPVPKISTAGEKKVFFFYNREMTRRIVAASGSKYSDIPGPDILVNGDFRAWLQTTNMDRAPQFKNGTIFEPGSIKRDGAGYIIDGVPFANNTVPKSMWQAKSAALLKIFTGVPGYTSLAAANPGYVRYYWTAPNKLRKDQDLLRVDYALSSKMNTYFRWVNDYQKEEVATGIWGGEPFPIQPQYRPKPGSSWSWNVVNTFSPKLAAETIVAYNHQSQELGIVQPNPIDRVTLGADYAQLYPQANITNSVDNVSGTSGLNFSLGSPGWHNDGRDYAFTENVTWIVKSHVMKFGFYYNRDNKKQTGNWGFNPTINFGSSASLAKDTGNGTANLMLGNFQSLTQPNAHVYPYFRFQSWEGYAQDSWKVNSRFTLEFGIRFQITTPTYTYTRDGSPPLEGTWKTWSVDLTKYDASKRPYIEVGAGRIVGDAYAQLSQIGLVCDPCPGVPRGFADSMKLAAPRVGFAYDLFGNGKTSVRGGIGVFYERLRQNNFYFSAGGHWPNTTSATVYYGNVANIDTSIVNQAAPPIAPPGFVIYPKDNVMPSIYSWNLGIQRDLGRSFAMDLSYVGNHAVHLMQQRSINGLPAGTFVKYPDLSKSVNYKNDALRPYYGWGSLTAVETLGYSSYNAMLFRLSRRFTNRFAMNVNYTWSKAMNLCDNDSDGIIRPLNMRDAYAPAGYDQTQVFTIDYVYQLPHVSGRLDNMFTRAVLNGWQISGITRFQSGQPFNVSTNGSLQGIDAGTNYPNVIGNPFEGQSQYRWLNPNAFQRPMDGSYGSLHRNTLRLPAVHNFDMTLTRVFKITEGVKFDLRAEFYNIFNHPQIWGINTSFTADNQGGTISASNRNLGIPTSWREPRILQFGFKLIF